MRPDEAISRQCKNEGCCLGGLLSLLLVKGRRGARGAAKLSARLPYWKYSAERCDQVEKTELLAAGISIASRPEA